MNIKKALGILRKLDMSYPRSKEYDEFKKQSNLTEDDFSAIQQYLSGHKYIVIFPSKTVKIKITPKGIDFLRREESKKTEEGLKFSNYILTVFIASAAILSSWVAYQSYRSEQQIVQPNLIGPEFICPPNFAENKITDSEFTLTNFGKKIAYEVVGWYGNNTEGLMITYITEAKKGFRDNFETVIPYAPGNPFTIKISMKIKNNNLTYASFYIKSWDLSNNALFMMTNPCEYQKENNTQNYLLIS